MPDDNNNGLPISPHKSAIEARGETEALINNAKSETRKRRLWAYVRDETLVAWMKNNGRFANRDYTIMVREYYAGVFEDPEAVVIRGVDSAGHICYAVWTALEWEVVCPDGGHRCTMQYADRAKADKKASGACSIDFDADVQTPCPGGEHSVEKVKPYTEPVF